MREVKFSLKDKIDKFTLKHQVVVKNIFRIGLTLFILFIGYKIWGFKRSEISSLASNSEIVVILAALLGATIGGFITYFINIQSLLKSSHIKSSIVNKKVIYEPLLIEYKNIKNELENSKVLYFSYDLNFRTIGSTPFEVWNRIKNDARYYQIPEYIIKEYLILENYICHYLTSQETIKKSAFEEIIRLLKCKGYEITENKTGIFSFINVQELLNRENILENKLLKDRIFGFPELKDGDKESIILEFSHYIQNTRTIDDFYKAKAILLNSLNGCIEITETVIIRITNEYERRNNIF
ncbi:hypothetical protein SAMN05192551_1212 [Tindallia magadiensis]|uniref:Uncharacterized protein n=1 Tax=Tindallia magadiensis TaxID=69895 RepID=A0A1I3I3K0_9FIRM|nr:hypothetical protein [Tindallia magadiensis]SFI42521.1 hypothetical protein SAMN05192551_1212 [Tindallia magadiensis]